MYKRQDLEAENRKEPEILFTHLMEGIGLALDLKGDGHVLVLAASIRSLEHLLYCFVLQTELATVPAKLLEQWASKNFPVPDKQFQYKSSGKPIPYEDIDLERPWETFDIQHELTRKGIEKFAADYRATLSRPA